MDGSKLTFGGDVLTQSLKMLTRAREYFLAAMYASIPMMNTNPECCKREEV